MAPGKVTITGWHEVKRSKKQHCFQNGKSLCGEWHESDTLSAPKTKPLCCTCRKNFAKQNEAGFDEMRVKSIQLGGAGPVIILNTKNVLQLIGVADSALALAKSAKCRITEGATPTATGGDALVPKEKLNNLKRELRKLSPGCLGKE